MHSHGNIISQPSIAGYPSFWEALSLSGTEKLLGRRTESGGTYSSVKFIPGFP